MKFCDMKYPLTKTANFLSHTIKPKQE